MLPKVFHLKIQVTVWVVTSPGCLSGAPRCLVWSVSEPRPGRSLRWGCRARGGGSTEELCLGALAGGVGGSESWTPGLNGVGGGWLWKQIEWKEEGAFYNKEGSGRGGGCFHHLSMTELVWQDHLFELCLFRVFTGDKVVIKNCCYCQGAYILVGETNNKLNVCVCVCLTNISYTLCKHIYIRDIIFSGSSQRKADPCVSMWQVIF